MQPSPEEFAAWRNDPVTLWVMDAARKASEAQKEAWVEQTWQHGGKADNDQLIELRTRSDAYAALFECEFEDWAKLHEKEEPNAE